MADISKIKKKSTQAEYNIKDSSARSSISTIEGKIPSSASASNKLATMADVTGTDIGLTVVSGQICVRYES